MASKMGKLGWCVYGWHPGGHTSQGVVDACIFDNQIFGAFLRMVFELKKMLQFLLGLFWSLPLVSLSLSLSPFLLGAFYKVWQGFTKTKRMPMQMIHKKI